MSLPPRVVKSPQPTMPVAHDSCSRSPHYHIGEQRLTSVNTGYIRHTFLNISIAATTAQPLSQRATSTAA